MQQSRLFNITEGAYGDVSLLINDGDNTTSWQAKYNDTTGKVLVDLKSFRNISSGTFIWGDKPPKRVKVSKYSGSSFTAVTDFSHKWILVTSCLMSINMLTQKENCITKATCLKRCIPGM